MKRLVKYGLVAVLATTMVACGSTKGAENAKVGVLQYSQHPSLDATYEGFKDGLKEQGYEEGVNVTIDFKNAQNDPTMPETLANKLVNDGNDLIYAIATPAAQAVAQKTTEIPVVYSAVSDPVIAGLVESVEASGNNFTGMSDLTPVQQQVDLLKELLPNAKTVAILYSNAEENSKQEAIIARDAMEKEGYTVKDLRVSDLSQIKESVQSLVGGVDALYIPTDNMIADGIQSVTMVAKEAGIPIISSVTSQVEVGVLASYGIDYYKLGYAAGLQAAKILKDGVNPSDIPTGYLDAKDCELIINEEMLEQYGIELSQEMKDKATLVR